MILSQPIYTHEFDNGLVLLAEPMDWLESAAFSLLVPAGCCRDPDDRLGLANLTCELVQRGAGSRDSRQFVSDLELLGADTSASVLIAHTCFGGAMPAESLFPTLGIYADVVRRPHLPGDQLDDARLSCIQEIRSIEDDLGQKAFQELRRLVYGEPQGRWAAGTLAGVEAAAEGDVRACFEATYRPRGAILSVAGKFDWTALRDRAAELFADWEARPLPELGDVAAAERFQHVPQTSSQTHIAIGYPSVPYSHPDYYEARAAIGVLSDGMSSRLFTEVRENRGLCYAVQASCHSLRDRGSVLCYAGTTTERAQETLDVVLAELLRLGDGIAQDELDRLKAKLKSSVIMSQESSTARSNAIAADWYHLGRVQTVDEVRAIIDGLDCDRINLYLASHPPRDFRIVTVGQQPLEIPVGIS
jgi:predicted Zn-dependent peptidase